MAQLLKFTAENCNAETLLGLFKMLQNRFSHLESPGQKVSSRGLNPVTRGKEMPQMICCLPLPCFLQV